MFSLSDWIFVVLMLTISGGLLGYANYSLYKQVKKDIETEKERVVTLDNEELKRRADELKIELKGSEEE